MPELERAEEIGARLAEFGVLLIGLFLLVNRTPSGVVARHGGDERDDGRQHRVVRPGDQHARESRLHGNLRELLADSRQFDDAPDSRFLIPDPSLDRPEFQKLLQAFADHCGLRGVDEGELLDVAEAEVEHREDDAGEGRAQDFGGRIGIARVEVLFGIESETGAGSEASAASGALFGGGLGDRFDLEPLDLRAVDVARDAGEAGVDDGADAGDCH